ncbi:unnamed protein product, partial [Gordionus sp. m RMFG-2023]
LLENPKLEAISSALSGEVGDCNVSSRIESYSCKMISNDKKLYKHMNQECGLGPNDLQALAPPQSILSVSPKINIYENEEEYIDENHISELCPAISRKILFSLISTLNASFHPDYDFSNAHSEEFSREPNLEAVMNTIDLNLFSIMGRKYENFLKGQVWTCIDQQIFLKECVIYSYNPDLASDPFGEDGILWSFNYFFHNPKLKRILFFTCRASSNSMLSQNSSMLDDEIRMFQ